MTKVGLDPGALAAVGAGAVIHSCICRANCRHEHSGWGWPPCLGFCHASMQSQIQMLAAGTDTRPRASRVALDGIAGVGSKLRGGTQAADVCEHETYEDLSNESCRGSEVVVLPIGFLRGKCWNYL